MGEPNEVRELDPTDRMLLSLLAVDGRMSNKGLADAAGIAPSTCLARLRRLRRMGALRSVHADVDPAWFGSPIQAMIAVRLRADSRSQIDAFTTRLAASRTVLNAFFVSGTYDFLVHIAASDLTALRNFVVDDLNSLPIVASTETHLIFDHLRGAFAVSAGSTATPRRRSRRSP